MAVEVHIIGLDGFGGDLWHVRTPWIDASDMQRLLVFTQVDPLTWMARITPQECASIIGQFSADLDWQKPRLDVLCAKLTDASTRQVEVHLAEW